MKKSDKRIIWIIACDSALLNSQRSVVLEYVPEENPFGRYTSEPIIRLKYGRTGFIREAESANTVYRMKLPRGRPRRAE